MYCTDSWIIFPILNLAQDPEINFEFLTHITFSNPNMYNFAINVSIWRFKFEVRSVVLFLLSKRFLLKRMCVRCLSNHIYQTCARQNDVVCDDRLSWIVRYWSAATTFVIIRSSNAFAIKIKNIFYRIEIWIHLIWNFNSGSDLQNAKTIHLLIV